MRRPRPGDGAVLADVPLLDGVIGGRAAGHRAEGVGGGPAVLRVVQLGDGHADQLGGRVAGGLGHPRVHAQEAAGGGVGVGLADGRVLESCHQGRLGPPPAGPRADGLGGRRGQLGQGRHLAGRPRPGPGARVDHAEDLAAVDHRRAEEPPGVEPQGDRPPRAATRRQASSNAPASAAGGVGTTDPPPADQANDEARRTRAAVPAHRASVRASGAWASANRGWGRGGGRTVADSEKSRHHYEGDDRRGHLSRSRRQVLIT